MHFLFLSIAAYLVQNVSNKSFSRKFGANLSILQNTMCVLFSAAILWICGLGGTVNGLPLLLSVLYGILYFATIFSLQMAMGLGSLGTATILCNMGNMLGVVFGILAFDDPFSVCTVLGIVLMILVVILSAPITKAEKAKGRAWFVFGILCAIGNGALGCIKLYVTRKFPAIPSGTFLVWAFTFAGAVGLLLVLIEAKRGMKLRQCLERPAWMLGCGAGAGMGTAFGNLFFMQALASGVSSAILFPVNTGVLSFLLFLMSLLVFKEEKFTLRRSLALLFLHQRHHSHSVIIENIKNNIETNKTRRISYEKEIRRCRCRYQLRGYRKQAYYLRDPKREHGARNDLRDQRGLGEEPLSALRRSLLHRLSRAS